jgi:acyl-CoA synthetase (AMP-forming)/AMP-acid ligase II
MNVFDYFFVDSKNLEKKFILGVAEEASFKQIYDDSLKLAGHLKRIYGEDNKIILLSQNSLFFITAYLGIIKSGNICVPLNPSIEQDNLDYIVGLTDCKLGFISKTIRSGLNISNTPRISESDLNDILRNQKIDDDISANGFDENRLAEIIFTSGSTGVPKGVMLSHLNLRANTSSIIEYLRLSQDDIVEVVLPFFYCYGLSLFHTHLKVGGSVVLNNNFVLLGSVIDNLKKYKCTGFAGVPSHYQILLKKSQTFTKTVFPDLRYVTQAGGKLHNVFIEEFIETFPEIKFYVMYGQTEATARLSFLPPEFLKSKMGSIGKGIPGVTLKVLNEQNKLVEVGEVGELVVKGDNVMSGYFKDPDGTNEVLKDGWLYTGDMAKIDHDGFIYLTARKKEILKVGGKRVSPKEIEEVILSVPEVLDCTIEGVDDDLLGEAIKATVVLTGAYDKLEMKDKVLKRCREKLSLYKIPQLLEFTEKLNVNSTGKKIKN